MQPTATATSEPTELATATATPEATFTSTPQGTASATVTPTAVGTEASTPTGTPEATPTFGETVTATQTATLVPTTTPTPSATATWTATPVVAPGLVIELVDQVAEDVVLAGDVRVDVGLPPAAESGTLGVFLDGASVPDFLMPPDSEAGGGLGVSAGTVSGTIRDVTTGSHRIQAEVLVGPAPGTVVVSELDFEAI